MHLALDIVAVARNHEDASKQTVLPGTRELIAFTRINQTRIYSECSVKSRY